MIEYLTAPLGSYLWQIFIDGDSTVVNVIQDCALVLITIVIYKSIRFYLKRDNLNKEQLDATHMKIDKLDRKVENLDNKVDASLSNIDLQLNNINERLDEKFTNLKEWLMALKK